jgi:hypothetical protein
VALQLALDVHYINPPVFTKVEEYVGDLRPWVRDIKLLMLMLMTLMLITIFMLMFTIYVVGEHLNKEICRFN